MFHTDEHYLKQLSTITKSQERYMMLKGLAQALEMKKDMLVQLNANKQSRN